MKISTTQRLWVSVVQSLLFFSIGLAGCEKKNNATVTKLDIASPSSIVAKTPLRLIVVDDEPLAIGLERQWQAADGGPLEIHNLTAEQFCRRDTPLPPTDVFIYPAALIGELAERDLIAPVPDELLSSPTFNRRDIFDLVRLRECNWGEKTIAFPLGSPQLMLLYRTDIFERFQLQPPKSWEEYEQLVETLAKVDVSKESGTIADALANITLEPTEKLWAAQMLLARSAAAARHKNQFSTLFDFNSMEPLIGQAPFVRALEQMTTVHKRQHDASQLSPDQIRAAFAQGKCAMAITWPARLPEADVRAIGKEAVPAGISPIPGSSDVFNFRESRWEKREEAEPIHVPLLAISGRLGSVAKDSRRSRSALNLLLLLSGNDWSAKVLPVSSGTTIFRESQRMDLVTWVGDSLEANTLAAYGNALQQSQKSPLWLFSPRIPGRFEYLAALDNGVLSAISGEKNATDALADVAKKWAAITERFGHEAQRRAYRRCLGLEP